MALAEAAINWRQERDKKILNYRFNGNGDNIPRDGGKYMDSFPLVELEDIPAEEVELLRAEWVGYTLMLYGEPKKAYVQKTIVRKSEPLLNPQTPHQWSNENPLHLTDLACGNGELTKMIIDSAQIPLRISMVDRSAPALYDGWERFQAEYGFKSFDGATHKEALLPLERTRSNGNRDEVRFYQKDITDTRIPGGSVDALNITNAFHHQLCYELKETAEEVYRILRPGGQFVFVDTAALPPENTFLGKQMRNKIDENVSVERLESLAKLRDIDVNDIHRRGFARFVHDARRAFDQAMSLEQLTELLNETRLAGSIKEAKNLRTSHPIYHWFFPPLNLITGYKK